MCTLVNAIYNPSVLKARARACGCVLLPGRGSGFGPGAWARVRGGRARTFLGGCGLPSIELSFDLVAGGVRPTPSLL